MMKRVSSVGTIVPGCPDDILITSCSFEPRCLGAVRKLESYSTRCAVIVDFLSTVAQQEGERRREAHTDELYHVLRKVSVGMGPRGIMVPPYQSDVLLAELLDEIELREIDLSGANVSVDITCFTKVQLLFLLGTLIEKVRHGTVRLLYTLPLKYNAKPSRGYRGPLTLPFTSCSTPSDSSSKRRVAIVALGHEGNRIIKAWRHFEPDSTLLILAHSNDKKLMQMTTRSNHYLIRRAKVERDPSFYLLELDRIDFDGAVQTASEFISIIQGEKRLVGIVPFGPKPIIAGLAKWAATRVAIQSVNVIYSVPRAYNAWYSEGIGETFVIDLVQAGHNIEQVPS